MLCKLMHFPKKTNQTNTFLPEYGKSLEDAIISDTSGHFRRLLVSLSQVAASHSTPDELSQNRLPEMKHGLCV